MSFKTLLTLYSVIKGWNAVSGGVGKTWDAAGTAAPRNPAGPSLHCVVFLAVFGSLVAFRHLDFRAEFSVLFGLWLAFW